MVDIAYPLFPVFSFLGFALPLIPLTWHLQVWNSGTCFYIFWTSLACLNQFVNSIVWSNHALNIAPVWCDISSRIIVAASVGIPMASLCINRRLYTIACIQGVTYTRQEKIRTVLIDTALCLGVPILGLVAYYCVEGHRFDIFEEVGCYPTIVNTLPSVFAFTAWPIVIGLVSAVYCILSLKSLLHRQAQFNQFLTSNRAISMSRYVRLMALATTDILFTVPLATFALVLNFKVGMGEYVSWEDTHYDFGRVAQYPAIFWKMGKWATLSLELTRWSPVICGLVFFAFFGFAEEARRNYANAFKVVFKPFAPAFRWLGGWRISIHHSSVTSSQDTLAVSVTASTCKFDYDKDLEKGYPLASPKSFASLNSSNAPFTPSSEPLPLYDLSRAH